MIMMPLVGDGWLECLVPFQHDPDDDKECVPGPDPGNYIMYASATSGNKPNNNIMSKCSLNYIKANVDAKRGSYTYNNCFITEQEPICGNRVRETMGHACFEHNTQVGGRPLPLKIHKDDHPIS